MDQAKEMAKIAFEALEDKKGEDVMWEIMEEDMAGLEYNAQRVIEEVEKTSDEVVFIREGKLVGHETMTDLAKKRQRIYQVYTPDYEILLASSFPIQSQLENGVKTGLFIVGVGLLPGGDILTVWQSAIRQIIC